MKALSVLRYLISSIKHELNIQTPCGTFLSVMTIKTPFSSNLLISLYHKSVNRVSYTRTNISIYRDCFADIAAELADVPIKLADILAKLADIPAKLANMPAKVI